MELLDIGVSVCASVSWLIHSSKNKSIKYWNDEKYQIINELMENLIFGNIDNNLLQTFDARAGWLQAWLTTKCKITENKGSAFRKILLSTNLVFFWDCTGRLEFFEP